MSGPTCPNNCSGNGECLSSGKCVCSFGWYRDDCSINVTEIHATTWNVIHYSLAIVFGVLSILALYQFLLLVFNRKCGIIRKAMMASTALACVIRLIWLAVDPFGFKGILPPIAATVLYQLVLGFITSAFCCCLIFWIKLAGVLVPDLWYIRGWRIPLELLFTISNIILWIFLIPSAILFKTLPFSISGLYLTIYSACLALYLLLMGIGFLTFGMKIYWSYLRKVGTKSSNHAAALIDRATYLTVSTSITILITILLVLLGSTFALDYPSTPDKYIIFQTLYRVLEVAFCLLVLTFAGLWRVPPCFVENRYKVIPLLQSSVEDGGFSSGKVEHTRPGFESIRTSDDEDYGSTGDSYAKRTMVLTFN